MKRGFLNIEASISKVQQKTKDINEILKFTKPKLLSNSFEVEKIENEIFIVYSRLLTSVNFFGHGFSGIPKI
jgi:hypothetical protein